MRVLQLSLSSALNSLRGNLFRSVLTIAGLAIGVASILLIYAIGAGLSGLVKEQLEKFDPSLLIITTSDTARFGRNAFILRARDTRLLASYLPQVQKAGAEFRQPLRASYSGSSARAIVAGMDAAMIDLRRLQVTEGRELSEEDHRRASRVALIGPKIVEKLFDGTNPIGNRIVIEDTLLEVVGILEDQGSGIGGDANDIIVTPLSTAQKRIMGGRSGRPFDEVSSIWITFSDASADANKAAVTKSLYRRVGSRGAEGDPFEIRSMEDQLAQVQDAVTAVRIGMSLIGSIAVFVAGIGILNTMLATIGERTREIGIRRAIGASKAHIRNQFIFEALCISTIGGLVGISLGVLGISIAWLQLPDWPLVVDFTAIIGVQLVAVMTGLIFGLIPAVRASRLSPVDALKAL
jgi:putative ABC transport system permease protein